MANFRQRLQKNGERPFTKPSHAQNRGESHSEAESPRSIRSKSIYLLPNSFTTASLFSGFYAIVMAMNLKFTEAAIAIFISMILDSLDGRVARMTNTQSEFGAQFDSLADMVAFGAAPALVIYEWSLRGMGKLGWLAAFIYCAAGALRLARFNTNIEIVDKRYFQGLPSPAAAAIVMGFVWVMDDLRVAGANLDWLAWFLTLFAGISMVSNVPFYSFKDFHFKKAVPFMAILLVVLIFVMISSDPPKVLFGIFLIYGISGYVIYAWRFFRGQRQSIFK